MLFLPYALLLVFSVALYMWRGAGRRESFSAARLRTQGQMIAAGFFPIFLLSVLLTWVDWRRWPGAVLIALAALGMLAGFAWLARRKPEGTATGMAGALLLAGALQLTGRVSGVLLSILYFYLFVALGEELFFRGYVQTRLNAVFGRPFGWLGIRWGWGLVMAALLFGLWHLGWPQGAPAWPHVLWTAFAGLLFGTVREKSDSAIASAVLHGILNYGPQAVLFALFWSGQ
jgi:membrane protease YdiL (CAAX protease family)